MRDVADVEGLCGGDEGRTRERETERRGKECAPVVWECWERWERVSGIWLAN